MCGGVGFGVDYGCPQREVASDKRSARVDEICWCLIWEDLWGVICVCLRGYGGVYVLVGLTTVKMYGVV